MKRKGGYEITSILSQQRKGLKHVKFLYDCIEGFRIEMEHYSRENREKNLWLNYGEQTMLGLFCAGIAKKNWTKKISFIQEFGVEDFDKTTGVSRSIGRCDLFINYDRYAYVIESKKTSDSGSKENRWSNDAHKLYLDNIDLQLVKYVNNQKDNYGEFFYKKVNRVLLVFNQIFQKNSKRFDNYIEKANSFKIEKNDFYQSYIQGDGRCYNPKNEIEYCTALEIYGRVDNHEWK